MPTILFVHGSGHAAWCWHEHFTEWFSAQGYSVIAPELPHHGNLDHHGIRFTPLRAYVDAVAKTAAGLDRPLTLVGHSLGGYIVLKYLEHAEADLAVLLASIPPAGAFAFARRMAARHPVMFLKTLGTGMLTDAPERTRELFFTPETPADVVDRCHQRLQPESVRVVMDVMSALHPERVTTPVVVMGAEGDTLAVPQAEVAATARAYHTTPRMVPGGHDMMLDTAWEQVATTITAAITGRLSV
jgi:alpha-beta hydrolase superfamily lysophospholipase